MSAFFICHEGGETEMAEFMEVTTRCARDRIREFDDEFKIKNGCVFRM